MPDATAAPEPPLEPPVERDVSHGLRDGPYASGSVVGRMPSSGVFVFPTKTKPAFRKRSASQESASARKPRSRRKRMPSCCGAPATEQIRSLTTNGTPRNGPSAGSVSSASSNSGWMTAFSTPFRASIRSIEASTNSRGVTSPERTRSAWAVASRCGSMEAASLADRYIWWKPDRVLVLFAVRRFRTRLRTRRTVAMEPVSAPPERKGKKGSLDNPEVLENVPGHVIPILEREFDDFDNEAEKFLAGDTPEDEFIGFRLKQGVYGQRQADVQMIRIKLPMGGVTP